MKFSRKFNSILEETAELIALCGLQGSFLSSFLILQGYSSETEAYAVDIPFVINLRHLTDKVGIYCKGVLIERELN